MIKLFPSGDSALALRFISKLKIPIIPSTHSLNQYHVITTYTHNTATRFLSLS